MEPYVWRLSVRLLVMLWSWTVFVSTTIAFVFKLWSSVPAWCICAIFHVRSRMTLRLLLSVLLVRFTLSRSLFMMPSRGFLTVLGSSRCPWVRTSHQFFTLPDSNVGFGTVDSPRFVPFAGPLATMLRSALSMVCVAQPGHVARDSPYLGWCCFQAEA